MPESNYAVQFAIGATLAAGFSSTFKKAASSLVNISSETKSLQEAQKGLKEQIKLVQAAMESYAVPIEKARKQLQALRNEQIAVAKGQIKEGLQGVAGGVGHIMMAKSAISRFEEPIKDAMEFESAMADVRKVVDGLDDVKAFEGMSSEVLKLSTELPMTAEGIAAIVAAGGQSGIAKSELLDFAKAAAKMGIAFDISADQAGDMMAKWRTAFKMNQSQVVELADKINYLGNTTAASAPLISDVVTRIGPLGDVGGVASGEIAALGASIVGVGVPSEVAATGIKNLILGMTAGEGATKSQAAAFIALGMDATEMSERMQTDAKGAILDVMRAIKNLNKEDQATVLKDLFGKESIGAIAPLLSNLENLEDNFNKVGSAATYTGSMEQEYISRCETAENATQLLQNAVDFASISLGNAFLPILKDAAAWLVTFTSEVAGFVSEHPGVVVAIGGIAAGLVTLNMAVGVAQILINAYNIATGIYTLVSAGAKIATDASTFSLIKQKAALVATKIAQAAYFTILMTLRGVMAIATAAQWAFNAALSANPIGLVILAIAALIAIGVALYTYWDEVKAFFISLWESPLAAIFAFIGGPITALLYIASVVIANWEDVKAWFILLWNDPSVAIDQFYQFVVDKFTALKDWLSGIWDGIKSIFSSPITAEVNYVKSGDVVTGVPDASMLPAFAVGGVVNRPTVALVGEGGDDEYIIPINGSHRARQLWQSAGQELGMLGGNTDDGQSVLASMPAFAVGGIVNRPTVAMVGEGGDDEYIIPINGSHRARQLWQSAGQKLGLMGAGSESNQNSFGAMANQLTKSVAHNSVDSTVNSSAQFVYSPNITVTGQTDEQMLRRTLSNGFDDFVERINQWQHQKRRLEFE
ncbi:phage tail tape measure protein [Veillonella caviae]|uniref:phage tail tape measure protein n=1 Tax=Veillonella caviae TaxID=248316 RepID=UPI002A915A92|nr:phage tail tape measure protein [Veillonella caviae]MDY5253977.1 phage tail tape measure protein [Veillonella caviae]